MSDDLTKVPKATGSDAAVAILRAGVGSIPLAGAAAAELFNWFVKAPLENRRDEWMRQVGETLEQLKANGIVLGALQKDQAFIDVVMQATHIAMRNHQAEKREALRNAIANSAGPHAPDESKRQMFLHLIDIFTVWHLKLLTYFADPQGWLDSHPGLQRPIGVRIGFPDLGSTIEFAFPELRGKKDFHDVLWNDLRQHWLVPSDEVPGIIAFHTPSFGPHITALGDELLAFTKSPETPAGKVK